MPADQLRLFQVSELKVKSPHFFTIKVQAKEKRNELRDKGQKDAHVSYGPDHHHHANNRPEVGWNKGKHPKKGHKGKSNKESFWKK